MRLFARFTRIAMLFSLIAVAILGRLPATEAPADAKQQAAAREVAALLAQLDSSRYSVRQQAARRMEELVARPEFGPLLAAEFQRALLRPDLSFEVRFQLDRWRDRLPKVAAEPPGGISRQEIERLVEQVDDDSFAVRLGAGERLRWAAGDPKLTPAIMALLKQRLTDVGLSAEAWQRFDAIYQSVRGPWLLSDPANWKLPPVTQEQIQRLAEDLARPGSGSDSGLRQRMARQELLDLLARDEEVPRVKAALEARLKAKPDAAATARLTELVALTRPAMVAEFWTARHNGNRQDLIVGVPTMSPGAIRPSHFDRIDDRTAHCVSGNSLSPGDYPAGVAFPHPIQFNAFFHLVNLPTPRRRMAYEYLVKTDEAQRLAAISRATFDRFLAEKHTLSDAEIGMLGQLDAKEVSRFAGRYFLLVDDGRAPDNSNREDDPFFARPLRAGVRSSVHGMICGQLACDGTKDAMPGLLEAIEKRRFLPSTSDAPYKLPWLAALAIAHRDPWPEVDLWLAGVMQKDEPLILGRHDGPELGASAAALLLARHEQKPAHFGLQAASEAVVSGFGIPGHRFVGSEARKQVQAWWQREREKAKVP